MTNTILSRWLLFTMGNWQSQFECIVWPLRPLSLTTAPFSNDCLLVLYLYSIPFEIRPHTVIYLITVAWPIRIELFSNPPSILFIMFKRTVSVVASRLTQYHICTSCTASMTPMPCWHYIHNMTKNVLSLDDFSCGHGPSTMSWQRRQLGASDPSWRLLRICSNQKCLLLRLSQTEQDLHDGLRCGRCQKTPCQVQTCTSHT